MQLLHDPLGLEMIIISHFQRPGCCSALFSYKGEDILFCWPQQGKQQQSGQQEIAEKKVLPVKGHDF